MYCTLSQDGVLQRRYPDGISWDQFQQEFTDRFFPQSHKDSKIEEFFKLEQKNMSVSDYEKKFSELVRLVPYIQADEVLKCKRFFIRTTAPDSSAFISGSSE